MDNLWAPWRMEYIKEKRQTGDQGPCVFCELAQKSLNTESLVLARGKQNYVVMNRYPYSSGHLLVVPYQHTAELRSLSPESFQEIMALMAKSMEVIKSSMNATGFNLGLNAGENAGGGILDHLHWHIVPRWKGDTNFLPILSNTRPLPEYLAETYKRLEKGFNGGL